MPLSDVLSSTMFHREAGTGRPIVFLHGNPTSSHLWREVLPRVGAGRLLAPDLIGMGRSGRPADVDYSFARQAQFLEAWLDAVVGPEEPLVFVGHDWGGALAFDWAARHPERVRGLAFLETIVRPRSWSEMSAGARPRFEAFRTPGVGERLVLEENVFIEQNLRLTVHRGLAEADFAVYAADYPTPESRRALLAWARAMPLDGEPADVVAAVERYDEWLATSPQVPKLLMTFDGTPSVMIDPALTAWCRDHMAALEVVPCGVAGHVAPEDQPEAIAAAVSAWLDRHALR